MVHGACVRVTTSRRSTVMAPSAAVSAMLRGLLLLATLPLAAAKGAGAWLDPKHYKGRASFAGMRFIAEDPPHVLNVVGTDDGVEWWHLKGACGGRDMTDITIDFAPKGGPGSVKGKWGRNLPVTSGGPVPPNDPDGHPIVAAHTIKFPDGNSWYLLETPLPAPAQPVRASRRYDDHVGAFTDPKHSKAAGASYAGYRFISESPPHVLSTVGSDDGETWWFVSGSCADPRMSVITLDFTPKGNTLLVGEWVAGGNTAKPGVIRWPDGNAWTHVETPGARVGAVSGLGAKRWLDQHPPGLADFVGLAVLVLLLALCCMICRRLCGKRVTSTPPSAVDDL